MSAFIGPLGQLVEVAHYKGSVSSQQDREISFKTTLGGGRRGFAAPNRGLREWSVSTDYLEPAQWSPLETMLAESNGPFVFVDPLATVTNAVTPRASLFRSGIIGGGSLGGVFTGADGTRFPVSLSVTSGNVYFGQDTPAIPGVAVTGSVYATAGTKVHLHILDSTGGTLVNIAAVAAGAGERVHLSALAPAGAVSARLGVAGGVGPGTVAGPAITWTDRVLPWSLGRGAAKVMAHSLSDSVTLASSGAQLKSLSFMVTEVGDGA